MKRWIVVLLIALAVIVLVSPGIVGRLAERSLEHSINWAGENDDFTVREERFERGWFTAAGRHRIELKEGAFASGLPGVFAAIDADRQIALIVDTRIDHGLVPLTSMMRDSGSLQPALASTVSTFRLDRGEGEPVSLPGRLFSTIGLTGETTSHYQLEPGDYRDDGLDLQWKQADVRFVIDAAAATLRYEGTIEPLRVAAGHETSTIGAVRFDGSRQKTAYGFSTGDLDLEVEATAFEGQAGGGGFRKLELEAGSELLDERVKGTFSLDMREVTLPELGTADLRMDTSVEGLDATALQSVVRELKAARQRTAAGAQAQASFPPEMEAALKTMLLGGGELRIDRFDLSLPQGKLVATMRFQLPASGKAPADFSWPGLVLAMTAAADLRVPAPLVGALRAASPESGALVAMGFLKRDGDAFVLEAEYAQGLVTVNGAPMPLPLNSLSGGAPD